MNCDRKGGVSTDEDDIEQSWHRLANEGAIAQDICLFSDVVLSAKAGLSAEK